MFFFRGSSGLSGLQIPVLPVRGGPLRYGQLRLPCELSRFQGAASTKQKSEQQNTVPSTGGSLKRKPIFHGKT